MLSLTSSAIRKPSSGCAHGSGSSPSTFIQRIPAEQLPLTTQELNLVKLLWEKKVQERAREDEHYQEDRLQLNLQPNPDSVLECRGQIQGHYPVYLPDSQPYTKKVVEHAHLSTLHGGVSLTMAKMQEHYWVPRLRKLAKRITRACHGCQRFQDQAY